MDYTYPEQWKKYDDTYWVSDMGRVKRVFKNGRVNYLTPVRRGNGDKSMRVKMHDKYVSLRRLVWRTFKGEIPVGYGVVNKNGYQTMNEIYNLALMPMKQCAARNSASRKKPIINIDTGYVYKSSRDAVPYLKLSHTTLLNYCHNKIRNPKYHLEFFDEEKNYKKTLKFIR